MLIKATPNDNAHENMCGCFKKKKWIQLYSVFMYISDQTPFSNEHIVSD